VLVTEKCAGNLAGVVMIMDLSVLTSSGSVFGCW